MLGGACPVPVSGALALRRDASYSNKKAERKVSLTRQTGIGRGDDFVEVIILVGLQGAGKTTFYKERFADSHIRLNLDMLKTRNRERILFHACLEAKQSVVIDNTNPTSSDRLRYIAPSKRHKFKISGYFFRCPLEECIERNDSRPERERIPEKGIRATYAKLEVPSYDEGFDELYFVEVLDGCFHVRPFPCNHSLLSRRKGSIGRNH